MIGYLALGFVIGFCSANALYLLAYSYYEQVCHAIRKALR